MKRQSRGPARGKKTFSSSSRKPSSRQSDTDRSGSDKKDRKPAPRDARNSRSEERGSRESRDSGSRKGSPRPSYIRGERQSRDERPEKGYRERRSDSDSGARKGSPRPSYIRGERQSRDEQPEKAYRERKSPGSDSGEGKEKSEWPKKPAARKPRAPREDESDLGKYQDRKKKHARSAQEYNTLVKRTKKEKTTSKNDDGLIRLNKFISNTGLCSRREADTLIESGAITVNGKPVTELGTRINPTDKVMYGDQTLQREKLVYLLLNKPKDYITTSDDPQQRKTVMELVASATRERIYPVGRLDRNTTGLLLFTNDGELTKKLTHPRHNIKKIYHVVTDQNVSGEHLDQMRAGFELEDGFIKVDDVQFVGDASNKRDIGVEIHSGRNRIVRRMFEHLGYKVVRLDRVMFAGLTKKDLPRGKWRFLSEKEVAFLKML